jgi:Asp-tRNA(Asn)/Glu-tRNA(Gln) amidotransferase A subunit family amidase
VTADADLAFLSARRIAALVRDRAVSPVEITRLYLDRIGRLDGELRAYITVVPEAALESARRAEAACCAARRSRRSTAFRTR